MSTKPIYLATEVTLELSELVANMTQGQKVHMANHLWKHHQIGPQKLLKSLEDTERESRILDGACDFWKQEAINRGYEE